MHLGREMTEVTCLDVSTTSIQESMMWRIPSNPRWTQGVPFLLPTKSTLKGSHRAKSTLGMEALSSVSVRAEERRKSSLFSLHGRLLCSPLHLL